MHFFNMVCRRLRGVLVLLLQELSDRVLPAPCASRLKDKVTGLFSTASSPQTVRASPAPTPTDTCSSLVSAAPDRLRR